MQAFDLVFSQNKSDNLVIFRSGLIENYVIKCQSQLKLCKKNGIKCLN